MFRCSTVNCYASISLKVDRVTQQIQRPIEIKTTNDNHIENFLAKEDAFFETKEFLNTVKKQLEMTTNQQKPVHQLYEETRSTQRVKSATTMPDYKDIKRWFDLQMFNK